MEMEMEMEMEVARRTGGVDLEEMEVDVVEIEASLLSPSTTNAWGAGSGEASFAKQPP